MLVTVCASTDIRCYAIAIYTRRCTDRFASDGRRIVPRFLVTGKTRADIRFGAVPVVLLTFFVANGTTSESVGIHPVILVTIANVRLDAYAVDAALCAHRHA